MSRLTDFERQYLSWSPHGAKALAEVDRLEGELQTELKPKVCCQEFYTCTRPCVPLALELRKREEKLAEALNGMVREYRSRDLPYGSNAYANAIAMLHELKLKVPT